MVRCQKDGLISDVSASDGNGRGVQAFMSLEKERWHFLFIGVDKSNDIHFRSNYFIYKGIKLTVDYKLVNNCIIINIDGSIKRTAIPENDMVIKIVEGEKSISHYKLNWELAGKYIDFNEIAGDLSVTTPLRKK